MLSLNIQPDLALSSQRLLQPDLAQYQGSFSTQIWTKHMFIQRSSYSAETKQLQMFSYGEKSLISQFYGLGSLRPGLRNFTCLVQADVWFTLVPWMLHLQERMNAVTSQSGVRGKKTKTKTTKTKTTHIFFIWLSFYKCGIHSWLGDLL